MTLVLLVLVPAAGAAAWAFLRSGPPGADRARLRRFNLAALGLAGGSALAWAARTYLVMATTVDAPWWPMIAALGALLLVSVVLAAAAAVRTPILRRRSGPRSR